MATVLCLNSHKNPFPAAYCVPDLSYCSSGVDLHIKIPRYFKAHKYRRPSCSPSISTSDEIQQRLSPVVNEINKEPNINSQLEDDKVNNIGVQAALSILSFYKREISPLLPRSCRYVPTCSEYSMIAYKKYGFVKGSILTAWRLCRCNPLGGSGFDPRDGLMRKAHPNNDIVQFLPIHPVLHYKPQGSCHSLASSDF